MEQALDEVDVRGETKSNELLRYLFRGQVACLGRVPCFENLLREIHVFPLLDHLHTCIFAEFDPIIDLLLDDKLLLS